MSWKIGSPEDNEHSVSSSLPVFHPSSKPKIYFLILLKTYQLLQDLIRLERKERFQFLLQSPSNRTLRQLV